MSSPLDDRTYFLSRTTGCLQSVRTLHESPRGWHYYWIKGSPDDPGQQHTKDSLAILGAILGDYEIRTADPLAPGSVESTVPSQTDLAVFRGVDLFDCFGREAFIKPAAPEDEAALHARGAASLSKMQSWLALHDAMLSTEDFLRALLGR